MGQRLNIAVLVNGKTVFNTYFHWSAYTRPSLSLSKRFMDEYRNVHETCRVNVREGRMKKMPNRKTVALVAALRAWPEAGIREKDASGRLVSGENLKALLERRGFDPNIEPLSVCDNRNDGMIGISEMEMAETERYEEFRVEIEVGRLGGSKVTRFDVWDIETISTYKEDFGEDPEYLEVKTGVLKYYRDPICSPRVDEIIHYLDLAPGWAIGCKAEDKMLVEIA